ncbi:hypothetical protein D3C71_1869500 [compost metagenome]
MWLASVGTPFTLLLLLKLTGAAGLVAVIIPLVNVIAPSIFKGVVKIIPAALFTITSLAFSAVLPLRYCMVLPVK